MKDERGKGTYLQESLLELHPNRPLLHPLLLLLLPIQRLSLLSVKLPSSSSDALRSALAAGMLLGLGESLGLGERLGGEVLLLEPLKRA